MMKIHWFSPLPAARTDIANYTARLAPYLSAHAEIVFCYDGAETPADFPYPVRAIRDLSPTELNQADLNIYHIGNNATFTAPSGRPPSVTLGWWFCTISRSMNSSAACSTSSEIGTHRNRANATSN